MSVFMDAILSSNIKIYLQRAEQLSIITEVVFDGKRGAGYWSLHDIKSLRGRW